MNYIGSSAWPFQILIILGFYKSTIENREKIDCPNKVVLCRKVYLMQSICIQTYVSTSTSSKSLAYLHWVKSAGKPKVLFDDVLPQPLDRACCTKFNRCPAQTCKHEILACTKNTQSQGPWARVRAKWYFVLRLGQQKYGESEVCHRLCLWHKLTVDTNEVVSCY